MTTEIDGQTTDWRDTFAHYHSMLKERCRNQDDLISVLEKTLELIKRPDAVQVTVWAYIDIMGNLAYLYRLCGKRHSSRMILQELDTIVKVYLLKDELYDDSLLYLLSSGVISEGLGRLGLYDLAFRYLTTYYILAWNEDCRQRVKYNEILLRIMQLEEEKLAILDDLPFHPLIHNPKNRSPGDYRLN